MTLRLEFQNSSEVGCFIRLTNSYCLVSDGIRLDNTIPTQIDNNTMVGVMTAGNSTGLLVPSTINDEEYRTLKANLPLGVRLAKIDDNLTALGNCIACNDTVALINPEFSEESERVIAETLNVEVYRRSIGGSPLTGTFCCLTNTAGIVLPSCSLAEVNELSRLAGIPFLSATINRGQSSIGSGLVANDSFAYAGQESTAHEMNLIDAVFKYGQQKEQATKWYELE